MFDDQFDERSERTVGKRNLAFAVNDVFLQIERHGFRLTNVFHGFGHRDTGLFADVEETVYRRARSENHGRMRQDFDPLCAEFLQGYAHYADKRFIGDLYFVFLG